MSRDCCVALPRGAMGLSAVCICGFPDHTHLLFLDSDQTTLYVPNLLATKVQNQDTFCILGNFACFSAVCIFLNQFFRKLLIGMP